MSSHSLPSTAFAQCFALYVSSDTVAIHPRRTLTPPSSFPEQRARADIQSWTCYLHAYSIGRRPSRPWACELSTEPTICVGEKQKQFGWMTNTGLCTRCCSSGPFAVSIDQQHKWSCLLQVSGCSGRCRGYAMILQRN